MSESIVFVSRNRVKKGKLEELCQLTIEMMLVIEASKPSTAFQAAYASDGSFEVFFVHALPDAEAIERHLIGAGDRSNRASELIEPVSMELFGSPGDKILQSFRQFEDQGIFVTIRPQNLGGFIRLKKA